MKIGFLGCGKMAAKMAKFIKDLDGCDLDGCAARDFSRANDFKENYGFNKAYSNYEDLLNDKDIELVYISTVTKTHYELIKLCLMHNKNILCEKPFCVNSIESREVIELAKKRNLYLAEAIWTRYMPVRKATQEIIDSGIIGKPYLYIASIGYAIDTKERMQDPIGGGVLLDCGVYPLNFVLMNTKEDVINVDANAVLTSSGVDETDIVWLNMTNNVQAVIYCTMKSNIDCVGYIYGDKGFIKFNNVNLPTKVEVYNNERPPKVIQTLTFEHKCGGYEYQWLEAIKQIKSNNKDSISMPLSETQKVMEIFDEIRKKAGIKFQNEK